MDKVFAGIRKVFDFVIPSVAGVMLLTGVFSIAYGVIVRNTNLPTTAYWVDEVSRYTIIWGGLLLMGICFRRKTQTSFPLLEGRLKGKVRSGYSILLLLSLVFLFGLVLKGGIDLVVNGLSQKSGALMISMAIPYLSVPLSALIVEIELLMMIAEHCAVLMRKKVKGKELNSPWK